MLIKIKLISYENHVLVHDGVQTITIAHGQEFDIDAKDRIVIEIPGATEVKANVEVTETVDVVGGNVTRTRSGRKVGDG